MCVRLTFQNCGCALQTHIEALNIHRRTTNMHTSIHIYTSNGRKHNEMKREKKISTHNALDVSRQRQPKRVSILDCCAVRIQHCAVH